MNLYKHRPERAFDLTWAAAIEEHFLGEALTSIGQMTALERVSWGLMRFFCRCETLGLMQRDRVPFPFRQQDLADALGLSLVHTNKTLKKLREQQIMSIEDGILTVFDTEKAEDIAGLEVEAPLRRPLI